MNNLITKLKWLIKESRKTGQNSISCGKVEEYIAEYEVTQDIINKKDNSGKLTISYKNLEQFELISKLLKQR